MKQPNDSRQRAKIWGYVDLMRACVVASILLLWSGAHQFGVRWNTVSWPTVLAISVIACTAVAPVPISDALAHKAHRLVRPQAGVVGLPPEALDAQDGRHGR